jgi:plasmid stabilization system protein ParE
MKRIEVVVVPTALEHVRQIDAWWQRERRSVPDLFIEEFRAALERLATLPAAGTVYPGGHRPDLRRLLMPRTRYHVYYVAERDRVAVLAVWHSRRGGSPQL